MSLFDMMNGSQQDQMAQLRNDPIGMAKQKGFNIPENLAGNPQAMVQHLIQTGQVGGPVLQRVLPMMQKLMGK